MIWAAEILRAALRFGHHGGGVMAAHVVKRAEFSVIAANYNQRLLINVDREKLAGFFHLIQMGRPPAS